MAAEKRKKKAKLGKPTLVILGIELVFLALILLCRHNRSAADFYSLKLYPQLSAAGSFLSSFYTFSMEEILVIASSILLIAFVIRAFRRKGELKKDIARIVILLLGIYVWFYACWGANYFRSSVYSRLNLESEPYDKAVFEDCLDKFTERMNAEYPAEASNFEENAEGEISDFYRNLDPAAGLCRPKPYQKPKHLLFTRLYSGVGVTGFVGPFFNEFQINPDTRPHSMAFTYAHELSHLLSVSSEAEANWWAFKACTASADKGIRFSGYYSLLPYFASAARRNLSDDQYDEWLASVRPEILEEKARDSKFWANKYIKPIGRVQDFFYNLFLKGNRISSGTANYGEVVGILIAAGEFD